MCIANTGKIQCANLGTGSFQVKLYDFWDVSNSAFAMHVLNEWCLYILYSHMHVARIQPIGTHAVHVHGPFHTFAIAKSYAGRQNANAWVPACCARGKKGKRWKPCSGHLAALAPHWVRSAGRRTRLQLARILLISTMRTLCS